MREGGSESWGHGKGERGGPRQREGRGRERGRERGRGGVLGREEGVLDWGRRGRRGTSSGGERRCSLGGRRGKPTGRGRREATRGGWGQIPGQHHHRWLPLAPLSPRQKKATGQNKGERDKISKRPSGQQNRHAGQNENRYSGQQKKQTEQKNNTKLRQEKTAPGRVFPAFFAFVFHRFLQLCHVTWPNEHNA